jgi:hypothetical protein
MRRGSPNRRNVEQTIFVSRSSHTRPRAPRTSSTAAADAVGIARPRRPRAKSRYPLAMPRHSFSHEPPVRRRRYLHLLYCFCGQGKAFRRMRGTFAICGRGKIKRFFPGSSDPTLSNTRHRYSSRRPQPRSAVCDRRDPPPIGPLFFGFSLLRPQILSPRRGQAYIAFAALTSREC